MSEFEQLLANPDYIFNEWFQPYPEYESAVLRTEADSNTGDATWDSESDHTRDSQANTATEEREKRENALVDRVDALRKLEQDWDAEGGAAPAEAVVAIARTVLEMLFHLNLLPVDVVPSAEGGVGIVFKSGERYADIEFFNDGDIVVTMSKRDGRPLVFEVKEITPEEIERVRTFLNSRSA